MEREDVQEVVKVETVRGNFFSILNFFAKNLDFLILISIQFNAGDMRYFKLFRRMIV